VYRLRALAELDARQSDAAATDVQMCLRLADAIKGEPVLISFLVRVTMLNITMQPVWEGLTAHRWNDSQLAALQVEFERVDQFDAFTKAIRGERLAGHHFVRRMIGTPAGRTELLAIIAWARRREFQMPVKALLIRALPAGWVYQNQLTVDRFYMESYLPVMDWENRRIKPRQLVAVVDGLESARTTPYNVMCKLMTPALTPTSQKGALSQTGVGQAAVACALERYRLAHGELPENLDVLVPQFLARVSDDVIDGQPLRYHRTAANQFVLYSIGWNEIDDGGQIAWTKGTQPRQDLEQGDWVWQSQPSASEQK
jgi:hypothetical protein